MFLYKLLRLAVAHCFLQNGPPFQRHNCWCFDFLMKEHAYIICNQLNSKYIPPNSGTSVLRLLLQKLENALLNEELESLIVKKLLHLSEYGICRNEKFTKLLLWKIKIS